MSQLPAMHSAVLKARMSGSGSFSPESSNSFPSNAFSPDSTYDCSCNTEVFSCSASPECASNRDSNERGRDVLLPHLSAKFQDTASKEAATQQKMDGQTEAQKGIEDVIDLSKAQRNKVSEVSEAAAATAEIPILLRQIEEEKELQIRLRKTQGLICEYDVRLWHLRNVWKDVRDRAKRVPHPTSNIDLTRMRNAKHQRLQYILQKQCEVRELLRKNSDLLPLLNGLRGELAESIRRYEYLQKRLQPQYARGGSEPTLREVLVRNCALSEKIRLLRQELHNGNHGILKQRDLNTINTCNV